MTTDIALWFLLALCTLAASMLSAVTGFGGAAILLPVLVLMFGVRDAVPILTVAQVIGNASRVWMNRRDVHYPVVGWFLIGAVPMGLLGGWLFASAPLPFLTRLLGIFLLVLVVGRHVASGKIPPMRLRWFAPLGGFTSFLSALVGTAGPIVAPFLLAFGLVKGAYIGTEALAALLMHATKLVAYGGGAALTLPAISIGMMLGPVMIAGSLLGKRFVDRVSERFFSRLVDAAMIVVGALFIIRG